ncbi:MAG: hypothetical protein EXQ87_01275 [Alphaproteobacteria bacterium]|nr:hypothetical protein [Alphaproteobacteria bacterium]
MTMFAQSTAVIPPAGRSAAPPHGGAAYFRGSSRVIIAAGAGLVIAIALLAGLASLGLHEYALREAERETATLSNVLARHTERTVQAANVILESALERAERTDLADPDALAALQVSFRRQVDAAPQIRSLLVFDRDGRAVVNSVQHPPRATTPRTASISSPTASGRTSAC